MLNAAKKRKRHLIRKYISKTACQRLALNIDALFLSYVGRQCVWPELLGLNANVLKSNIETYSTRFTTGCLKIWIKKPLNQWKQHVAKCTVFYLHRYGSLRIYAKRTVFKQKFTTLHLRAAHNDTLFLSNVGHQNVLFNFIGVKALQRYWNSIKTFSSRFTMGCLRIHIN